MPVLRSDKLPKYRHHKATRQAVVTLSGQDFYLGPYGTSVSRREYDRLVTEWQANGRRLRPAGSAPNDLSVNELADQYLAFAEQYYVKEGRETDTVNGIRRAISWLCEHYGDQDARDFGPLALLAIQQHIVAEGKSRRYVNDSIDRLRRLFKWAASRELVPVSVHQALQTVPGLRKGRTTAYEPPPVLPVSQNLVDLTLPFLRPTVAAMVQVQRLTGCRPDEVCQMRPCDVDRTQDVWAYRPESHKTQHLDRDRVIFIGPRAQTLLAPFMLRPAEAYCFCPAESEAQHNHERRANRKSPMTPSQAARTSKTSPKRIAGARYTTDSYRRAIHRACDHADEHQRSRQTPAPEKRIVPRWSPNRLRHSAATEIRSKYGLEASQLVLGHSNMDVTQIYAERDMARAAAIIREVG